MANDSTTLKPPAGRHGLSPVKKAQSPVQTRKRTRDLNNPLSTEHESKRTRTTRSSAETLQAPARTQEHNQEAAPSSNRSQQMQHRETRPSKRVRDLGELALQEHQKTQKAQQPRQLQRVRQPRQPRQTQKVQQIPRAQPTQRLEKPRQPSIDGPSARVFAAEPKTRSRKSASVISDARIEYWNENGAWPTTQEEEMDRFRDLVEHARYRKRSLSRKRSNASMSSESSMTGSLSRVQKCAPYRHQLFEDQLMDCGSFMDDHELGITPESEEICQQLLDAPQSTPENTLFSDDDTFRKTCNRLKGENETKVTLRISQLIVPSAEMLADQGDGRLASLRETTNASWTNSMPFINLGSGLGSQAPRPQPDFGLGFNKYAFSTEQRQKLQPFLGDLLLDSSYFAATSRMYFPFLTSEVKCGAGELDIADRQNAYSQSVILIGLHEAFKLAGRESELHRQINGFSISHNAAEVRIYGHYLFLSDKDVKVYRHLITNFLFRPSGQGDQRWQAYKFVKNVYDLWVPKHFERLCSVIDMLPDVPDPEQQNESSQSGLSQQFDVQSLVDANQTPDSNPSDQPITPDATTGTASSKSKRRTK